jgi:hypothetical protein
MIGNFDLPSEPPPSSPQKKYLVDLDKLTLLHIVFLSKECINLATFITIYFKVNLTPRKELLFYVHHPDSIFSSRLFLFSFKIKIPGNFIPVNRLPTSSILPILQKSCSLQLPLLCSRVL